MRNLRFPEKARKVKMRFGEKSVDCIPSKPLSIALYASGIKRLSSSVKFYRPRGFYSIHSLDRTVLLTVNGVPLVNPSSFKPSQELEKIAGEARPPLLVKIMRPFLDTSFQHRYISRSRLLWPLILSSIKRLLNHPPLPSNAGKLNYSYQEMICDVLVIGGGVAGLSAALESRKYGLNVVLMDDKERLGGRMYYDMERLPSISKTGRALVEDLAEKVRESGVKVMLGTIAAGFFEDALIAYTPKEPCGGILYRVEAKEIILAVGAVDLPCLFPNNDLPGVISASTALRMLNEYGVQPGKKGVVLGVTEYGVRVAKQLAAHGIEVTLIDKGGRDVKDLETMRNVREVSAKGSGEVKFLEADGRELKAEFIACAAAPNPDIKLPQQVGAEIRFTPGLGFTPLHNERMEARDGVMVAGGVSGSPYGPLHLLEGRIAGLTAAVRLGFSRAEEERDAVIREYERKLREMGLWSAKSTIFEAFRNGWKREVEAGEPPTLFYPKPSRSAFICLCEDIHTKDIYDIVMKRGFSNLEKVKRCTGICTGHCQGRLCMVNAALYVSYLTERDPNEVGLTRIRPPITPIPLAAFAEVRI